MQDMYSIGHKTLKLDGVITEFADIYAPLAQIWKNTDSVEEVKQEKKVKPVGKKSLQHDQ